MNRIFLTSEIDDIISTDREIIKSVLDLIEDIKKVASESSSDATRVSSEAKKGDVSGVSATVKNCIENDAYSQAKTKLKCVENNIKGIKRMDKLFAKQMSKLSQSTNRIKDIIKELDSFIINTPLTTPASDYNAALSAKMTVWEKILKDADASVKAIKKMAKGAEKFSAIFSSDPVNLSTGNFIYEKTDLEYGGNDGFYFKRFYNSVNDYEGFLGKDWITNYEIHLSFIESNVFDKKEISIIKEDGKEEIFLPVDEKRYTPQSNSLAEINVIENGYEYKTIEGNRYLFDKEGFLERYEDGNGQGYSTEYSQIRPISKSKEIIENSETVENRRVLQKVIKDSGEYFVFAYSEDGYLKEVTDSEERKVAYEVEGGMLLAVTRPDGTSFKYTYSASGKLRGVVDPRSVITVENEYDQEFRVIKQHFPDGTSMSYEYDDENNTVTQTERNGAVTVHYHDEQMRNVKNVYPDGEESFIYNSRGLKISMNDKNGNTTRLSYDNRGNVTSVINALGIKYSITYNKLNKPITASIDGRRKFHNKYDKKGNLLEVEDGLGRKRFFKYNEFGRLIRIVELDGSVTDFSYDDKGNIIKIRDSQDNITQYFYDNYNRVIKITDPLGLSRFFKYDVMNNIIEETNAEGKKRTYTYNESGKVTQITDYDGNIIKRTYNAINKPEIITDKEGRETRLQYDAMWNLARVITPDGGQITYIYNENNRLTRIKDALGNTTRFTYDGMGNRLSIEDAEGLKTFFGYDALGRMIKTIDSEGYETNYEYDAEGNLIKVTDKNGNIFVSTVDSMGQVLEEKIIPASGGTLQAFSRKYSYDLLGNVTSVTTETGVVTKYTYLPGTNKVNEVIYNDGNKEFFTYNANGYIDSKTDRNGVTTWYAYDSLNRLVEIKGSEGESKKYTYDALGNVTTMTDVLGNVTKYEYSLSGKLTKVIDALGNYAEYAYDLCDRLISVNQYGSPEEPPRITEYKRNILGQVETVIDSLGQQEGFKYNKRGELIEKIDKEGYITKYGYTSRGDVNHLQYSDGREVMLSYDAMRHLAEVKDWLGTTKITNDSLGRTTEVVYPDEKKVSYSYNSLNQRTEVVYPDGKQIKYIYDENARLSEIVTNDSEKISYTYNDFGRLVGKEFSNGTKTTYDYNTKGLLSRLAHTDAEGILDEYIYSYDNAFNKIGITKNRRGLEESGVYSYGYDAIGRLSTVSKDSELLRQYSYDAFGNRTLLKQMTGEDAGVTKYRYDALNQLTEKDTYDLDDSILNRETYTYDKRGNLSEVLSNGQMKNSFVYGAINRLEETINAFGESAKYIYDGLGHRVGKEEYKTSLMGEGIQNPEKKISYLIDITREYNNILEREVEMVNSIEEIENIISQDRIKKETFFWDGGIAGRIVDKKYDYYLKDELGSPIRLIDENGETAETYGYDEFGNDLYDNQGVIQPFGYTGYQKDNISGTYFALAREYDPVLGRFEGEDKVAGKTSRLFTQNRYSYCFNDGVSLVDKDGRFPSVPSIGDIKNDISDWWNDVCDDAEEAVEYVSEKASEAKEYVSKKVDEVKDVVVDKVYDAAVYVDNKRKQVVQIYKDYIEIPDKETHYSRNQNNQEIPQTEADAIKQNWDGTVPGYYHGFTGENHKKYVSPDGSTEVIYDASGNIVTAVEDEGTYNFCPKQKSSIGHFFKDMLPYYFWGNSPDDTTYFMERVVGPPLYKFNNYVSNSAFSTVKRWKDNINTLKNLINNKISCIDDD